MANPRGQVQQTTDGQTWTLPFRFTITGGAGAVSAVAGTFDLPAEVLSVARSAAGRYTFTLKEKWGRAIAVVGNGVSATVNRLHLRQDNVQGSPPTVVVGTIGESAGTQAEADLADGTVVSGVLYLKNK